MPISSSNSTLAQLQSLFPNAIMVDAQAMAKILGIAYKTLNNRGDAFPIRPVRFGRRKLFRISDIATYIDGELGIADPEPQIAVVASVLDIVPAATQKRGRGRPRKVAVGGPT